jgi:hypothetical protein
MDNLRQAGSEHYRIGCAMSGDNGRVKGPEVAHAQAVFQSNIPLLESQVKSN